MLTLIGAFIALSEGSWVQTSSKVNSEFIQQCAINLFPVVVIEMFHPYTSMFQTTTHSITEIAPLEGN